MGSLRDFISKNIVDLGGGDKTPPPVVKNAESDKKAPVAAVPAAYVSAPVANLSDSAIASVTDMKELRQHFSDLMQQNNQPGNDYFEYQNMLVAISLSIPSEPERYRIAFSGLSTAGLTKEILLTTGRFYIDVIEKEAKEYEQDHATVFNKEVTGVKAVIEEKRKQMIALSEQINALNEDIKTLSDQVTHTESSLTIKKNSFIAVAEEFKNNISEQLKKIEQYVV